MKKFFLFCLVAVVSMLTANAQMAYLFLESSIENLPVESFNDVDRKPEQNVANWFKATYVDNNTGVFVSVADLKAGLSESVKVLWINIDRVGLENLAAAGIDADAIAAVKAYVEKGGQLLLTKQVLDDCGAGIIEFKPQAEGQGTILTNGFAADQWGTGNDFISNVQLLTKNSLNYLLGYDPNDAAAETDLWKGSQHISWQTSLKLDADKFANAQAGDKLVVHYAKASDGIEFKVMNDNYAHLAGSREAAWINGEGTFEQFLTAAAVDSLKQYGLEIVGANFDLTQVELLEGKELKEGITIWTGFFWADSWTTLELYKEGYSYIDWSKIESVRFYSEANRTNYSINVKSSWEDDGHIADKGAMTDGDGYAELTLTDDMRQKLAASGHLMVQFDKGEGEAFNATDIVAIEKQETPDSVDQITDLNLLPADAVIYNILGMRVQKEDAHGGIFIINGKKMVIR